MAKHYLLYASERYALAILRPIQDAIRERGDVAAWFFDGPGASDLEGSEQLLETVAAVKAFNPVAVMAPGNRMPDFFPGVKVEVFHGFDAGKPKHIYIRGLFDLYCTTGPRDTQAFEKLAEKMGHFSVRETGWSKLDPFVNLPDARSPERPTVLYHSTFSPSWSAAEILHDTVRDLSRTGAWNWIVTLHPKMNPTTVDRYRALEGEYLKFATDDNILNLFPRVDVMVSDTSSALSEFLLWHKPVVTFKNRRPGPYLIDIDDAAQLQPSIARALSHPPELMEQIRRYTDAIHPYRDGRSSERVLQAIDDFVAVGGRNRRPKPLNFLRKWRIRKRLGYYHLR